MNLMPDDGRVADSLRSLISFSTGASYVEARYQARLTTEVNFVNGELERIRVVENTGCGVRVLVDGCWGFSSTNDLSLLKKSLDNAVSAAQVLARTKKKRVKGLAESKMMTGTIRTAANGSLSDIDIEQKVQVAREGEKAARSNRAVKAASCTYREILDHKAIVSSDGADVEVYDSKPEFSVSVIARAPPRTKVSASPEAGTTSLRKATLNMRSPRRKGPQSCSRQST
jgi:TldD protein